MDFVHGGAISSMNFLWSVLLAQQLWVAQPLPRSLAQCLERARRKLPE